VLSKTTAIPVVFVVSIFGRIAVMKHPLPLLILPPKRNQVPKYPLTARQLLHNHFESAVADSVGLRNDLEVNEKQAVGWKNVRMLEFEKMQIWRDVTIRPSVSSVPRFLSFSGTCVLIWRGSF
jgi:hypothetical protein